MLPFLPPPVRDLYADTWVAADALGRRLPLAPRAPRKDRFVGVFYFVWHGLHGTPGPYDITGILQGKGEFGPPGDFHWWGEPEVGYFRATDPWVARRNLQLLADAGVDALFVDATNAFTYPEEMTVLFDQAERMRDQGIATPQVAFVLNAHVVPTVQRLWDEWYRPGRRKDHWFRWLGKPLILADVDAVEDGKAIPEEVKAFFTWRRSWFESDPKGWFGDGRDRWPWRDRTPQAYGWHDDPKTPEEVAVGVASHPTNDIGRSYKDGKEPANPEPAKGLQFQEQWDRALAVDPKLVFVTGWNEWVAQRFLVAKDQTIDLKGGRLKEGDTFFVDQYDQEYSRDIDPMRGGHGDATYYQLVANVRRFKGARPVPRASAPKTVSIAGPFSQWAAVGPEYRDPVGDTMHRDHAGWGSLRYRDESGRNDVVAAKVARDAKTVAFYVETAEPLTKRADDWMVLYLDVDRDLAKGFHGYDLRAKDGFLDRYERGAWRRIAPAPTRVEGRRMHLAVPRRFVSPPFDFKWADHCGEDGLFLHGDAAPPRRFRYRYQER